MEETGVLTDGESDGDEGPTEYDVAAQQAPKWYNNHIVALLATHALECKGLLDIP